ncbi:hypothetical protein GH714_009321 [Hevea brasiliensis]|uniref:DUF4378 domain-containing protein n=1 Tax=Hevea brasiliensis TaxID=3981 RepID=A0A6A6L0P9_HEVBR|nr:hypothetical protein GH714_009321 [Hevea brasiliensis]
MMQRPSRCNLTRRSILHTRKILKLLLYKLIRSEHSQNVLDCRKSHKYDLICKTSEKLLQSGGSKGYSSRGSSVAYHESLKCGIKDSPCNKYQATLVAETSQPHEHSSFTKQEVSTDINLHWECEEDGMKLGPRSLLNEATPSDTGYDHLPNKEESAPTSSTIIAEEDSIFSAFLTELLVKPLVEKQNHAGFMELQETIGPVFSELLKNRTVLQQTKQLIFDFIKEAIENHQRKNGNQKSTQEFMDLEKLGKIIRDKICPWENQNAAQHINFDVSSIVEEWDDIQQLHRKIGIEIGDAIMDEIIQEVISFFSVKYCVTNQGSS